MMRFGIGRRILSGLALIALVLSIFFWFTLDHFDTFRAHFEQVARRELPDLIIAAELEQEAAQLVALTQDILLPREKYLFVNVQNLIEQSMSRALTLINDLERNNGINVLTDLLAQQYRRMANNQLALITLKEKQLHLIRQQERIHRRLADVIRELNDGTLFLPEQATVTTRSALHEWHDSILRAIGLLLASHNTRYQQHIEKYARQMEQDIATATDALGEQRPEIKAKTLRYHKEIFSYGIGDKNLFILQAEALELRSQIEERLYKGKNLAAGLLAGSRQLHENAKTAALMHETAIIQGIDRFRIILLILAMLIFTSLAMIYLFVSHSVINRILAIQRKLSANSSGETVFVQETGNDELTTMAREINHFLRRIQQRERQLKNAAEEAEATNKAKNAFIANMSHEIRTPMNAIINLTALSLEAQLDTELDSKLKSWLEIVHRSSKSLLNLTNDILDSAKVEAGRLELSPAVFSLSDLLAKLEPYQIEAKTKGLDFTISVEEDIPEHWLGDYQRIGQILINLVSNAIKFTAKGSIEVEVEFYRDADEQWLLFNVCDSGIGIREDKLESIFSPFNQADNSTTRIYGGTGLGLTISQQLVELMGGRIQAECGLDEGSIFQVVLPLNSVAEEDVSMSARIRNFAPNEISHTRFEGRAVLLVEDNPFNQVVAEELLELVGITVDIAEDGIEALKMVKSEEYELILMDLHMPRMNGCETGLAIRKLPGRAEIPIIILTANATYSAREQCLRAGMNDVITKPINTLELFRALERWLNADGSAEGNTDENGEENIKQREEETKTEIQQEITGDKLTLLDNPTLLRAFVDIHGETVQQIRQALADADQEKAHRLAHNLKSAAGTVKAEQLCQQAEQLEEFFDQLPAEDADTAENRAMNDAITTLLDQAEKELFSVLEQIILSIS